MWVRGCGTCDSQVSCDLQYPWDIVKEAWRLGLLNGGIPVKFGGLGLGVLDECIVGEELAYGCTGIMTALTANGLAVS